MSDGDVIRRIAERGLSLAQTEGPQFIDIFQHLLDEIERCDILPRERACRTCQVERRKRFARQSKVQPILMPVIRNVEEKTLFQQLDEENGKNITG